MTRGGICSVVLFEADKAFKNKWFYLALIVGMVFACASAYSSVVNYLGSTGYMHSENKYYSPYLYNCFGLWMSVDQRSPSSILFYKIAPLLATLPYSWSLGHELQSGYLNFVYSCAKTKVALFGKALISFFVGGVVVVLPQIVNILIIACFVPAFVPSVTDAMMIGILDDNLFSFLFYNTPLLYVLVYCLMDFLLCGLWAVLVLLTSFFIRNVVVVLTIPYFALLVLQFVNERIFLALGGIKGMQLSLFENLKAGTSMYVQSADVIFFEILILVIAVAILFYFAMRRDAL